MTERHSDATLDASGLLCPLPVLKARRRLLGMKPGQVLHVIATDPMAAIDLPHFCAEQGYEMVAQEKQGAQLEFWVKRLQP